jgi:hypothetical protein
MLSPVSQNLIFWQRESVWTYILSFSFSCSLSECFSFIYLFTLLIPMWLVCLMWQTPSKGTMGSEGLLCWTAYLEHLSSLGYNNSMHKKWTHFYKLFSRFKSGDDRYLVHFWTIFLVCVQMKLVQNNLFFTSISPSASYVHNMRKELSTQCMWRSDSSPPDTMVACISSEVGCNEVHSTQCVI